MNQDRVPAPPHEKVSVKEEETVNCLSCCEDVEVKKMSYGNGYIAVCPKCTKLAYIGE